MLANVQAALAAMDLLAHEIPAHSDVVILRRDILMDTNVEDNLQRIEFARAKYPAARRSWRAASPISLHRCFEAGAARAYCTQ